MIPKTIHYCWFGRNPKPKLAEKCIRSWKLYCPDYEIIEWNEDNYDISAAPLYVRQAYEAKKWAFVTDYIRLDVVYRYGGIYLDTDVELIKPLDSLLQNEAYFGLESPQYINTGLGFGAEKGAPILSGLLADYQSIPFVLADGSFDQTSCPVRNTEVFLKHGFNQDGSEQVLADGIHIYPSEVLNPKSLVTGEVRRTEETVSIHWYEASWLPEEERLAGKKREAQARRKNRRRRCHESIRRILGERCYTVLKDLKNRVRGF